MPNIIVQQRPSSSGSSASTADQYMSYRLLAPFYDWLAPNVSRYRSPQLMTAKVLEIAPAPCELLDIGVGTGLSVAAYVTLPRFTRIVGVDPSAHMLKRCHRKFTTVELHQGTLEAVKGDLGPGFDIIQSCGAVEHMRDLTGFVRHVSTLLRPGGYFVFTYEPELLFSLRQSTRAPHIGTLGRERVFRRKPHEVYAVVTDAGLRVDEDFEFKAYLGLVHHLVIARHV
jgi:predicted TPR repeat methyltransferase